MLIAVKKEKFSCEWKRWFIYKHADKSVDSRLSTQTSKSIKNQVFKPFGFTSMKMEANGMRKGSEMVSPEDVDIIVSLSITSTKFLDLLG